MHVLHVMNIFKTKTNKQNLQLYSSNFYVMGKIPNWERTMNDMGLKFPLNGTSSFYCNSLCNFVFTLIDICVMFFIFIFILIQVPTS